MLVSSAAGLKEALIAFARLVTSAWSNIRDFSKLSIVGLKLLQNRLVISKYRFCMD